MGGVEQHERGHSGRICNMIREWFISLRRDKVTSFSLTDDRCICEFDLIERCGHLGFFASFQEG